MIKATVAKMANLAPTKIAAMENSLAKYFLASMFAGIYVGFGIILIFSIGGPLKELSPAFTKLAMGASFGVALTLVIFAGSELFTGNNMIMTIGSLSKTVTWKATLKLWLVCYVGNLAGSVLLAYVMSESGLIDKGATKELLTTVSSAKMNAPILQLFIRGVLCNILVCLAVWMAAATKSDSAKLILIFWCLFAFIGSGFEHSIANMTLLGMGLFENGGSEAVTWAGYVRNLVPVTLGNIVGGAVFMGAGYWYIAGKKGEVDVD